MASRSLRIGTVLRARRGALFAILLVAVCVPATEASATTWSGSCHMTGNTDFAKPVHLTLDNNGFQTYMSGTCTGTLNGKPYNGPVTAYTDGRMNKPMSCLLGAGNEMPGYFYFGSGSPADVDATLLYVYTTFEFSIENVVPFAWRGAYNGDGVGQVSLKAGRQQLQECAGAGLRSVDIDVTNRTITPFYG